MADIKWIKLAVNIFDNRKIKIIETLPNKDKIILIWIKLLCLAGQINDEGNIYITKDIPYTPQSLASMFGYPTAIIKQALDIFKQYEMVEITDNFINIINWEKYQSVASAEKAREQTRIRVSEYRERQKMLAEDKNVTSNVTVTLRNGADKEEDKEKEKEKEYEEHSVLLADSEKIADPPEPIFIKLILNTGELYGVPMSYVEEMKSLYPAVDVEQSFRNMAGWLDGNEKYRKTKGGIKRFINNWLRKDQDNAHKTCDASYSTPYVDNSDLDGAF